jgi:hypothetical protein
MKERERLEWPEFSQKPAFKVASRSGSASVALYRGPISERTRTVGIISSWPRGDDSMDARNALDRGFGKDSAQAQLAIVGGPDGEIGYLRDAFHYKPLLDKLEYDVDRHQVPGPTGKNRQITVVTSPTVAYANDFAQSVFGDDRLKLEAVPGRYTALEFLTAFVKRDTVLVAENTDGEGSVWQLHDDAALQQLVWSGVDSESRDELKKIINGCLTRHKEEQMLPSILNMGEFNHQPGPSLFILRYIMDQMHQFGDSLAENVLIEGVGQDDAYAAINILNTPPNPVDHPRAPRDFVLINDKEKKIAAADRIQGRFEKMLAAV